MKNVIFDLDDTLSNTEARQHHLEGDKKNWHGFFQDCDKDAVITHMATLFRMYRNNADYNVHILTGRSSDVRKKTLEWLHKHDLAPSGYLAMRKSGDLRADAAVKMEMVKELDLTPENTEIVFDDRDSMVKSWRDAGFKCVQVAEGKY